MIGQTSDFTKPLGLVQQIRFSSSPPEKQIHSTPCHAPKLISRAWWSFHTSNPNAQNGNNTNIRIVIGNLLITKFMFRVVG